MEEYVIQTCPGIDNLTGSWREFLLQYGQGAYNTITFGMCYNVWRSLKGEAEKTEILESTKLKVHDTIEYDFAQRLRSNNLEEYTDSSETWDMIRNMHFCVAIAVCSVYMFLAFFLIIIKPGNKISSPDLQSTAVRSLSPEIW